MPDMLLPFEATLKGSPYIFMAVQRKASEALKKCSTAETAENAEQKNPKDSDTGGAEEL